MPGDEKKPKKEKKVKKVHTAEDSASSESGDEDFTKATPKEQSEILRQVSLFEDRIHKLLGVSFKQIISSSNFTKAI